MKFEIELSDDFSGPEIWKKISTDVSRPLEWLYVLTQILLYF
jgi:hypothetical protein